jgi:hypothetical protein
MYCKNVLYIILYHVVCQLMSCFLIKKAVIITLMGDKKIFSTRVDDDRIKDLKHLAVDTDKSLGELLEEAIQDIVKKYEKKLKK